MEYNKMIELVRQSTPEAPETTELLAGVHRTLQVRRRQQAMLASIACIALLTVPLLTLNFQSSSPNPSPTLAEAVSATVESAPNNMPAPLAGYRNSIRNHQTLTII